MELKAGDYVVHEQHGIGRFLEMRQRTIGTGANKTTREYLVIEYAPSKRGAPADKLFIPTDQLDLISKYIGAEAPSSTSSAAPTGPQPRRRRASTCTRSPRTW